MTLTMNLLTASLPLTKSFEQKIPADGVTSEATSSVSKCPVINITDYRKAQVAIPPNCHPISKVAAEWAQNEQRRQMLAEARQWLANTFHGQDGDTVRALRLRRGWSQSQLAEAIKTSQSHIARIERGTENVTIQTCRRLCVALAIDMNTLDQALRRQEIMVKPKGAAE